METSAYIVTVNALYGKNGDVNAQQIYQALLEDRFWAFSSYAWHLKRIKPGDRFVVYAAGGHNGYFVAFATVADSVSEKTPDSPECRVLQDLGIDYLFDWVVPLKDIIMVDHLKVRLKDLVSQLQFISNKRYYGVHIRNAVIRIPESDLNTLLHACVPNS